MAVIAEQSENLNDYVFVNNNNESKTKEAINVGISEVGEYFANKNIFITGGTGFLGTVLIESLLSSHPDIGCIYVLVRGKKRFDPNERIDRLLQKPLFKNHSKKTLAKVIPVVGELSEPNFGFKEDLLNELLQKVNIIFHSAATIKFSSPLRTAIRTNLTGTWRTIEFAKKLKNLSSYIFVSTAFCNSNNRGLIMETVYKSKYDPHEMMKMAEDDLAWEDFDDIKCKEMIGNHPNTYTFTKNLAENLMMSDMAGFPAAIVRPSIVYGTWEHPCKGWVGAANSGHLGYLAGFIKGIFRTMCGVASSMIDIIPVDYVINSTLVMAWYAGTRKLEQPEVIHSTSGEVNPLSLGEFCDMMNEGVKRHPADSYVWKPQGKLRNGWRYNLFFYIFHMLPAMLFHIPEKLFNLGMPQHTALEYMRVFHKGAKAFDYFLDKDFRYSLKNSLRVMSVLNEVDRERYTWDASLCDWSEFLDRCLIGVRHFYFKESAETTQWHRNLWTVFNILHYCGLTAILLVFLWISGLVFGSTLGYGLAFALWSFLMWL